MCYIDLMEFLRFGENAKTINSSVSLDRVFVPLTQRAFKLVLSNWVSNDSSSYKPTHPRAVWHALAREISTCRSSVLSAIKTREISTVIAVLSPYTSTVKELYSFFLSPQFFFPSPFQSLSFFPFIFSSPSSVGL